MWDVSRMSERDIEELITRNRNIERRKLEIKIREWKSAYEQLGNWMKNNFNDVTLSEVTSKINELRPGRE